MDDNITKHLYKTVWLCTRCILSGPQLKFNVSCLLNTRTSEKKKKSLLQRET